MPRLALPSTPGSLCRGGVPSIGLSTQWGTCREAPCRVDRPRIQEAQQLRDSADAPHVASGRQQRAAAVSAAITMLIRLIVLLFSSINCEFLTGQALRRTRPFYRTKFLFVGHHVYAAIVRRSMCRSSASDWRSVMAFNLGAAARSCGEIMTASRVKVARVLFQGSRGKVSPIGTLAACEKTKYRVKVTQEIQTVLLTCQRRSLQGVVLRAPPTLLRAPPFLLGAPTALY